nr:MAG TPA: hypothetical protein [Caudoviricetes sp.]
MHYTTLCIRKQTFERVSARAANDKARHGVAAENQRTSNSLLTVC